MSEENEKVLLNLKILSDVKENDKLYLDDETNVLAIDKNYYLQSVVRAYYGQSRDKTINFINELVNQATHILETTMKADSPAKNADDVCLKEDNIHLVQRFVKELNNSTKGIDNLRITYRADTTTTSSLNLIVEKINIILDKVNRQLKLTN